MTWNGDFFSVIHKKNSHAYRWLYYIELNSNDECEYALYSQNYLLVCLFTKNGQNSQFLI